MVPVMIPASRPEPKRTLVFGMKMYRNVNSPHKRTYGNSSTRKRTAELKAPRNVIFSRIRVIWVVMKMVTLLERMMRIGQISMSDR